MKAILVIDIPNEYTDRYNVNEMYVWNLVVQDKQGYQMFGLTTDKPSHLKPLPKKKKPENPDETWEEMHMRFGWNDCLDEITGDTDESSISD